MNDSVQLIAFDMDGVVADTEPLHQKARERILLELGCDATSALDACVGLPIHDYWEKIIGLGGVTLSPRELERMQYDYILEQMRENNTPLSDGLAGLLDFLSDAGIRCGICSSSNRYYVDRVLAFFNLSHRFSPVVGGDQVARKKPAPDGYRLVIEEAGIPPDRILAVEDSKAGVAAATGAGLRCIGYVNPTSGAQDLGKAFLRIHGLAEIRQWLQKTP